MGCCSSTTIQAPAGRGPFPAPLPAPMQDNVSYLIPARYLLLYCHVDYSYDSSTTVLVQLLLYCLYYKY